MQTKCFSQENILTVELTDDNEKIHYIQTDSGEHGLGIQMCEHTWELIYSQETLKLRST